MSEIFALKAPTPSYSGIDQGEAEDPHSITLGQLRNTPDKSFQFRLDQFAPHGVVICGEERSGRSYGALQIAEEANRIGVHTVILSMHADMAKNIKEVHSTPLGAEFCLPFFDFDIVKLSKLLQVEKVEERALLQRAIQSLAVVLREPGLGKEGVLPKALQRKRPFLHALRTHIREISAEPLVCDISRLPEQLLNECVFEGNEDRWGNINEEQLAQAMELVTKVRSALSSPALASIFFPDQKPSLKDELANYLRSEHNGKVHLISLNELKIAPWVGVEVLHLLAEEALQLAHEKRVPILFIIDAPELCELPTMLPLLKVLLSAGESYKLYTAVIANPMLGAQLSKHVSVGLLYRHAPCSMIYLKTSHWHFDSGGELQLSKLGQGEIFLKHRYLEVPVGMRVYPPQLLRIEG